MPVQAPWTLATATVCAHRSSNLCKLLRVARMIAAQSLAAPLLAFTNLQPSHAACMCCHRRGGCVHWLKVNLTCVMHLFADF